jgi:hypothetical protein
VNVEEREDGRGACVMESLEPRALLAADLFRQAPVSVLDAFTPRAIASHAVPATPAATRSPYPQVVGTWVGTLKTAGKRGLVEVAVRLSRQVGPSATGKFALGPASAWNKVLSTAVLAPTLDRSFRVILPGKAFYGSVNATVSANAQQIVGRWTCNVEGDWKSGTIVLNRQ